MAALTHLIILSITVDFILVNKRQHDPVTDNSTLEDMKSKKQFVLLKINNCHFKVSR